MQPVIHRSTVVKGLAIAAIFAVAAWGGMKGWRSYLLQQQVQQIVVLSGLQSAASFADKIETLRAFINDNSQHKQDAEFYATWRNPLILAERMVKRAKDKNQVAVHLDCSTRTALMTWALAAAGFTTRRIDIYDATTLKSHTFVDVLNPQTGQWETQDPDYDISWRDRATGRRVSIAQSAVDLDQVEPCGRSACGWDVASRERFKAAKLKDYLDFISVKSNAPAARYTLYTPRADPNAIYNRQQKSGRFCEVVSENCRDGFFDLTTFSQKPNG